MNILDAVMNGDLKSVQAAVADLQHLELTLKGICDEDGLTPLMYAARYLGPPAPVEAIVQALLQGGCEVDAACVPFGNTALHYACGASNGAFVSALRKLAPEKFAPYSRNRKGRTPVAIAQDQDPALAPSILNDLDAIRFQKIGKGAVHLAVVGTGPAGTGMFVRLVRELEERRMTPAQYAQIEISLFDSKEVLGTGTPYCRELNSETSLLNIAAMGMSVDSKVVPDFIYWLDHKKLQGQLAGELGPAATLGLCAVKSDVDAFYPRLTYGRYLADSVQKWVRFATKLGMKVHAYGATEVTEQKPVPGPDGTQHYQLSFISAGKPQAVTVTHVFRASGHWTETKPKPAPYLAAVGSIQYPANVATLTKAGVFNQPTDIGVLGSSLSAIDAIFAVLLNPKVGTLKWDPTGEIPTYVPVTKGYHVTAYSRKGLFSKVRPRENMDVENVHVSARAVMKEMIAGGGHVSIPKLIGLLNKELTQQLGKPTDVLAEIAAFDKPEYKNLKKDPFAILADEAKAAVAGDGRTINQPFVRWYQVVHPLLDTMHLAYRQFTPQERIEFDQKYNSNFLWAFAPMPDRSAKILVAMHQAGVLDLFRSADNKPEAPNPVPGPNNHGVTVKSVTYDDKPQSITHPLMLVTIGLGTDANLDDSAYAQSVVREGLAYFIDPNDLSSRAGGVHEFAAFTTDNGSFELLDKNKQHSPAYRGIGYLTHSNIWDIQAVPAVVGYGSKCAVIYADEFEQRLKPPSKV